MYYTIKLVRLWSTFSGYIVYIQKLYWAVAYDCVSFIPRLPFWNNRRVFGNFERDQMQHNVRYLHLRATRSKFPFILRLLLTNTTWL